MAKRNRASVAETEMNEMDQLLAGIEADVPEGLIADELLAGEEFSDVLIMSDEASFDDLIDEDAGSTETIIEPEQVPGGIDPEVIVIDKQAFYDAQESSTTIADEEEAAPAKKTKGRNSKEKVAVADKPAKTPRTSTTGLSRAETLTAKTNLSELMHIGIKEDEIPELVERINVLPAKVQDKAYNMLRFASGRETLSNYTRFVIERLAEDGPQTVPQIVAKMEARGWSSGTSRSQSQQISRLLRAYNMIEDGKGPMTLKTEHPFAATIIDRLAVRVAA